MEVSVGFFVFDDQIQIFFERSIKFDPCLGIGV